MTTKTDEQEREIFKRYYDTLFDLSETTDTWGNQRFVHESVESIWYGWQARAALQSQPKANDMMLSGVLRMPFDMAMASELSRMQFYQRAQQALDELKALQSQDREDVKRLDWLDKTAHCADWMDGEPTKRVIRAHDGAEFTGDTWREAIDHARRIEEEAK